MQDPANPNAASASAQKRVDVMFLPSNRGIAFDFLSYRLLFLTQPTLTSVPNQVSIAGRSREERCRRNLSLKGAVDPRSGLGQNAACGLTRRYGARARGGGLDGRSLRSIARHLGVGPEQGP